MPRRTKEDALATRSQLLDAAECVFSEKGVARTSLNDIAQQAGVSRGAIYWHFTNKADVFNAMMDRVTLPMEDALNQSEHQPHPDYLSALVGAMLDAVRKIATDVHTRRVFEVATHKVEFIDELVAIKDRQVKNHLKIVTQVQKAMQEACAARGLPPLTQPTALAYGLFALVLGLVQNWLLMPDAFDLPLTAEIALASYLAGLGLETQTTCNVTLSDPPGMPNGTL